MKVPQKKKKQKCIESFFAIKSGFFFFFPIKYLLFATTWFLAKEYICCSDGSCISPKWG